jgi:hypothetical protein
MHEEYALGVLAGSRSVTAEVGAGVATEAVVSLHGRVNRAP